MGVVYSKDLARLIFFRPSAQRLQAMPGTDGRSAGPPFVELRVSQVMRDVLVVPETKTVLDLIRDFQQRRRQMAIVVDEYGSTVGLVTAEDAIEQLTGELEDEFDDPARPVLTTASGALLMDGGVNLRDLETQMQWSLPREGGVETLAGFSADAPGPHSQRRGERGVMKAAGLRWWRWRAGGSAKSEWNLRKPGRRRLLRRPDCGRSFGSDAGRSSRGDQGYLCAQILGLLQITPE